MKILITGGAGFIGSALIRHIIENTKDRVINVDKLTYAGNLNSLKSISDSSRYTFYQADICNMTDIEKIINTEQPDCVMHMAAESHVDRSIDGPAQFIQTNIVGTFNLLDCTLRYFNQLNDTAKLDFRFHHISTDEVYGDLDAEGYFTEQTAYRPSSPYSASKASSDHLVRAWQRTYGLPTVITNCSNNYGPFHFPEKLIPLMILNALEGKPLPVYGDGSQVRDWLYVDDHARALHLVACKGAIGETYNIGGHNEHSNLEVVENLCQLLEELAPCKPAELKSFRDLITFVNDRPGHDLRYAIDADKIKNELNWVPQESFNSGLRKTVEWYLANLTWCRQVQDGSYQRNRLGVGT